MCSVIIRISFAFFAQLQVAYSHAGTLDNKNKLLDTLADKMVAILADHALRVRPLHHAKTALVRTGVGNPCIVRSMFHAHHSPSSLASSFLIPCSPLSIAHSMLTKEDRHQTLDNAKSKANERIQPIVFANHSSDFAAAVFGAKLREKTAEIQSAAVAAAARRAEEAAMAAAKAQAKVRSQGAVAPEFAALDEASSSAALARSEAEAAAAATQTFHLAAENIQAAAAAEEANRPKQWRQWFKVVPPPSAIQRAAFTRRRAEEAEAKVPAAADRILAALNTANREARKAAASAAIVIAAASHIADNVPTS
eukprot:gnl/MRDRNA2_/MRDRNA2_98221_c0_seq1.p1 gnl/MRDRNA2_/MRDRNA2_98221_c0~~gnl/MRDRNA2_/MRDRNA2_98221_c0_seq1.p1  ORF type:complete len:309 (-),score=80.43 gnl/MRDRNA2_/MRDRNA2_98221_c0_seq1:422-1348(-)